MNGLRKRYKRRGAVNRDPLRRVVERFTNAHGVECERLECGHVIHRRQDAIGPTNAERRRCYRCAEPPEQEDPRAHGWPGF